MKLLLAGGGTGGHLIPGLSVAEAIARRQPDSQIWLFGTPRAIDRRLVPAAGIELIEQPVRPFSTRPWRWPGFYLAWRASCRLAAEFIRRHRPDVVLGLGGYAAAPAVRTAVKMGIPAAILNPDAVPGRANYYLAKRVSRVFCQWEVTVGRLPRPAAARVVGCPVRRGIGELDKRQCRRELGLDAEAPLLLATGASLGAATLNEAVGPALAAVASRLDRKWQVLHQTGEKTVSDTSFAADKFAYRRVAFIDRMDQAIAAADLVICRAGASTLAELAAIGRPAILMPYPFHRDQHQRHNGQVLVDAGAAVMITDVRETAANAAALAGPLAELMLDASRREAMGRAGRAIGRPAAADAVADELTRLT